MKLNKRGKKFFKGVKAFGTKVGTAIQDYESKAPQRRAMRIKRLQEEIKIAKLEKQKKALQPKYEDMWRF